MNLTVSRETKRILIYILSISLVVGGVITRPIMYVAFIFCAGIILVEKDLIESFSYLFFLMPFATVFKLSVSASSLFSYILLLMDLKLLFSYRKLKGSFGVFWILYSGYILIGMGSEITDAIKQIFLPVMLYFGLQKEVRENVKSHAIAFSDGVIISSILGLLKDNIPNLNSFVVFKNARMDVMTLIQRFSGLWGDPNYYSINLILVIALTIYFHIKGDYSIRRSAVYYALMTVFGALTGSKTFVAMAIIVFVWLVIEAFRNRKYAIGGASIIVGGVVLTLIWSGRITAFSTTIERILTSSGSLSTLTTFRTDLWIQYFNYFVQHPFKTLIGNGLGKGYTFTAPHNTVIDYIDLYGIVGSVLFIGSVTGIMKGEKRGRNIYNYIPIIALFLMYLTLSMIRYLDYGFQLLLAMMIICPQSYMREEGRA